MTTWLSTGPTTRKKAEQRNASGSPSPCPVISDLRDPKIVSHAQRRCFSAQPRKILRVAHHYLSVLVLGVLIGSITCGDVANATADRDDESSPVWEPLLWGGKIVPKRNGGNAAEYSAPDREKGVTADTPPTSSPALDEDQQVVSIRPEKGPQEQVIPRVSEETGAFVIAPFRGSVIAASFPDVIRSYVRDQFQPLQVKNIPPLYLTPRLPGEGVWDWKGMPGGENGRPAVYRTSYRPSASYPNAVVHMLLFDMKRVSMRMYVGTAEPGASRAVSRIEPESRADLLAVTNALWKQKHSMGAGAIFRGEVLQEMAPGMATLVVYTDDSVDILEWNNTIPVSIVHYARQLRHLIVKDGKVVESIMQNGQKVESEIGLGYLLPEDQLSPYPDFWGGWFQAGPGVNYGPDWFIATRSAFGIRRDGNLVFAIGHHISTKDLAKALVLAGCERAIHGDANPHNVLGNLYYTREDGTVTRAAKLSPDQREDTLRRYVDRPYTSDFFAFFRKSGRKDPS